jgi:hypothetical protein
VRIRKIQISGIIFQAQEKSGRWTNVILKIQMDGYRVFKNEMF